MKITQKHTPGPWGYRDGVYCTFTVYATTQGRCGIPRGLHWQPIAQIPVMEHEGRGMSADEADANARLIAAAPDLLAVVQRFARHCEQNSVPELQGIARDALTAIARATSV